MTIKMLDITNATPFDQLVLSFHKAHLRALRSNSELEADLKIRYEWVEKIYLALRDSLIYRTSDIASMQRQCKMYNLNPTPEIKAVKKFCASTINTIHDLFIFLTENWTNIVDTAFLLTAATVNESGAITNISFQSDHFPIKNYEHRVWVWYRYIQVMNKTINVPILSQRQETAGTDENGFTITNNRSELRKIGEEFDFIALGPHAMNNQHYTLIKAKVKDHFFNPIDASKKLVKWDNKFDFSDVRSFQGVGIVRDYFGRDWIIPMEEHYSYAKGPQSDFLAAYIGKAIPPEKIELF